MPEVDRPIHARVFRIYLDYLRVEKGWTPEKVSALLSELGTSMDRLNDDSSWFALEFADRFYDLIVKETKDPEVAYKAGLFVHRQQFSPVINQMIRAFVNIGAVYKFVSRFAGHFSKAAKLSILSVHGNSATIEAIPEEGIHERSYICQNRRGILAGVPLVFGLPIAEIHESECLHRGGSKCVYGIKWTSKQSHLPIFLMVLLSFAFVLFTRDYFDLTKLALSVGLFDMILMMAFWAHTARKRSIELHDQNVFLDTSLSEIERKNRQLEVVSEISKLTQSLMSPEEMGKTLVTAVCQLLEFDRALLLLTDFNRHVLKVEAYSGFPEKLADLLSQTEFHLSSDNSSGFFVKVVNTKQPILIQNISKVIDKLSPRSQTFAKMLGAKSFVAVPLLDENQSVLGVLAVDYVDTLRQMTIADQDLLMTLGGHLAISIHNAKLLSQLEENLQISRGYSEQQKILRKTFQKFVPTDLAQEIMAGQGGDLFERLLKRVKKRPAAIMFGDIAGFSTITESMEAENVVDLVNTVFSKIEPKISSHQGFVDKFTGDGFIAIFEEPEACLKACAAASDIVKILVEINSELFEKGYPKISLGLGINYGSVILGNVGSVDRLNFTAMGEAVNLAARLESHTRNLGDNSICVSSAIYHRTSERFQWKDLGDVQLKGYRDLTHVFQLLTTSAPSSDKKTENIQS